VVTICTASLTFNISTFCPHSVFMCFVWIWEQTAIICLCIINRLLFETDSSFILCVVTNCIVTYMQVEFILCKLQDRPSCLQTRTVRLRTYWTRVWVSAVGGKENRSQDTRIANCRETWLWTFSWRRIEVAEANTMIFWYHGKKSKISGLF
jgi:hypothetical protein